MSHSKKLIMIFTMLLGGFGLLNETLLTTALPRIMKDFHIDILKYNGSQQPSY